MIRAFLRLDAPNTSRMPRRRRRHLRRAITIQASAPGAHAVPR